MLYDYLAIVFLYHAVNVELKNANKIYNSQYEIRLRLRKPLQKLLVRICTNRTETITIWCDVKRVFNVGFLIARHRLCAIWRSLKFFDDVTTSSSNHNFSGTHVSAPSRRPNAIYCSVTVYAFKHQKRNVDRYNTPALCWSWWVSVKLIDDGPG